MRDLGYYDGWYHKAPDLHQSTGMLLLFLLFFRLLWVGINTRPVITGALWEQAGAKIVHRLHYFLMLVIMLSGYLIPTAEGGGVYLFGWLQVPALLTLTAGQADFNGELHRLSAWSIMALAGVHAAAALKHHLINRDETLIRMTGITKSRGEAV